jgi:adenylate cyclase, class 2
MASANRHRPRQNLELKTRYPDLPAGRDTARRVGAKPLGVEHQVDTYFRVSSGRLKLREIEEQPPVLIWYERPDQTGARTSLYYLVPVNEPALLKTVLTAALGFRGVIEKRREIFLWHNVRIHLDEVAGLGSFVEFEAVVTSGEQEAKAPGQLQFLCGEFGISHADHLASSYADLVGF